MLRRAAAAFLMSGLVMAAAAAPASAVVDPVALVTCASEAVTAVAPADLTGCLAP
ncbi:hypothetical protein A8926_3379 [Saccharopolyspora spinosa]|uniref:Uncharacterized protein n=1 Tax=Saccharopolyspora spinosa TaxID=60894 RepID=A0A2N3XY77_SACSN|nr:hypothetical protein A8926_3379 [Saccharopolyspora spinosa]